MTSTYNMSSLKTDIKDIPEAWIYKFYSEKRQRLISQPFDGRIIKIRSFTNRDSEPSLCIYYNEAKKKYLWKDHSSGQGGDAVEFVKTLLNKTYSVVIETIIKDYEQFLDDGGNLDEYDTEDVVVQSTVFKETNRPMKLIDLDFWRQWKILSGTLNKFDVKAIDRYTMSRSGGDPLTYYTQAAYGFYSRRHGLYQIYQPNGNPKYLNTKTDYLIGRDQLTFTNDVCLIVSGLKDLMATYHMGLDVEFVAPKSENTLIKYDDMEFLKSRYKYVISMLDNDDPGIKAMKTYQKVYNIPFIHINLEQDLAKNNKRYEIDFLRSHYSLYINKKINE